MQARTVTRGLIGLLGSVLALLAPSPLPMALAQSAATFPSVEVVYIETDPWAPVIGSDSPNFALYRDGTVIFRASNGYKTVKLSPDQHSALLSGINLSSLDGSYDFSNGATDQPVSTIYDFRGSQSTIVSVYGNMRRVSGNGPRNLQQALTQIRQFNNSSAQPWLPELIEVMVWPYENAPEGAVDWPGDWPNIRHSSTRSRGADTYSLFLPSSKFQELTAFLGTRKQRGSVRISGREWAVAVRYPFPGEAKWMQPY